MNGTVGVAVAPGGNMVFLACGRDGVAVVNTSKMSSPSVLSRVPGRANDVKVSEDGRRLYVAAGPSGMKTYGLQKDGTASLLSTIQLTDVVALSLSDQSTDLLFAVDSKAGLAVVDVSAPAKPYIVSTLATGGSAPSVAVASTSTTVYVAAGTDGVAIFGVSDPNDPQLLSMVAVDEQARGVAVLPKTGLLWVADDVAGAAAARGS